ncbi:hypothetical protein OE88DRAFT_1664435 [Heliocybe sulcata]|uniref:CID domain-containing protein n=1 Tax=Heliocybe sulcata TaxID=5364 RepID=A0A5C3MTZ5_9AGAM|nr:hypothetical protein OE88DRAFT_1664435 [Heliocybe sulcata]
MGSSEEFEAALKDVVQGKHLSASKMNKLTEVALKYMENDTQLVSILYRTHKNLSTRAKISSLYAFDALARAARHKANKHAAPGDTDSGKGNCATFLLKVEGVLEGLFQDMISSGAPEAKEKTKKVLDIWHKSNTFPSAVLGRLADILKEADKEPGKQASTPDPRPQSTPSSTTPPIPPPAPQPAVTQQPAANAVQSTLLALLSQAANAAGGTSQISPNTGANPAVAQVAQLDVNHLALIQQLAQTSQLSPANTVQSTSLPFPSTFPGPPQGPNAHPPYPFQPSDHDDRRDYDRRGLRHDPRPSRSPHDYPDDRRDFRGGYRGGYRGRERGRGMDDRDRFRDRGDRDWYSPPQGRRSRSRSPPGGRYGRDSRQSHSPFRDRQVPRRPPPPYNTERGERDEFGRDIRPQNSRDAGTGPASHDQIDMQSPAAARSVASSLERSSPTVGENNKAPLSQPQSSVAGPLKVGIKDKGTGLDDYDFSTFDPTLPASWEALGKAWQVTNGYQPSTEEIMQLVMAKTMSGTDPMAAQAGMVTQGEQWGTGGWQQPVVAGKGGTNTAPQWPSGNGTNDGHSYGNVRAQDERPYGGQDMSVMEAGEVAEEAATGLGDAEDAEEGSVASRGRMQKVGDRWVFVKGAGAT